MKTKWQLETLKRDNYKCIMCGKKKRLVVHHKDESRKLGPKLMNNKLSNLITLCFNCHIKIHGKILVAPHKKKIIQMRREGASLKDISIWLNFGCASSALSVLKTARIEDPTIEIDYMNHLFDNKWSATNHYLTTIK